jgi:hypothetical protein
MVHLPKFIPSLLEDFIYPSDSESDEGNDRRQSATMPDDGRTRTKVKNYIKSKVNSPNSVLDKVASHIPEKIASHMPNVSPPRDKPVVNTGSRPTSPTGKTSPTLAYSHGMSSETAKPRETREQKENFILLVRALLQYLEIKDPALYKRVKEIVKDCAERHNRNERGYESFIESTQRRLDGVVDEVYWRRAEKYTKKYLSKKAKEVATLATNKTTTTKTTPTATTTTITQTVIKPSSAVIEQKEDDLLFIRILLQFLEIRDPIMHTRAKKICKDSVDRHNHQEAGYENVTDAMMSRLKNVVDKESWGEAQLYMKKYHSKAAKPILQKDEKSIYIQNIYE